jgi:hypothetical protein
MHELRKERSTVDHASSSAQVNSSQLHHNHQSSHLAIALDTSHTSTLVGLGVWEIDFHVGHAYSYRMFRPDRLCQLDIVWTWESVLICCSALNMQAHGCKLANGIQIFEYRLYST